MSNSLVLANSSNWEEIYNAIMGIGDNATAAIPSTLQHGAYQFVGLSLLSTKMTGDTGAIAKALQNPDVWSGTSSAAFQNAAENFNRHSQNMEKAAINTAAQYNRAFQALQNAQSDAQKIQVWAVKAAQVMALVNGGGVNGVKGKEIKGGVNPDTYPEVAGVALQLMRAVGTVLENTFEQVTAQLGLLSTQFADPQASGSNSNNPNTGGAGSSGIGSQQLGTGSVGDGGAGSGSQGAQVPNPPSLDTGSGGGAGADSGGGSGGAGIVPNVPGLNSGGAGGGAGSGAAGVQMPKVPSLNSGSGRGLGSGGVGAGGIPNAKNQIADAQAQLPLPPLLGGANRRQSSGTDSQLQQSQKQFKFPPPPNLSTVSPQAVKRAVDQLPQAVKVPGNLTGGGGTNRPPSGLLQPRAGGGVGGGSGVGGGVGNQVSLPKTPSLHSVGGAGQPGMSGSGQQGAGQQGAGTTGAVSANGAPTGTVPTNSDTSASDAGGFGAGSGTNGLSAATPMQGKAPVPGGSGMPYMPMGGMGGGAGGQRGQQDRERTTWLAEDRDVWGSTANLSPNVLRAGASGEAYEPELVPVESVVDVPSDIDDAAAERETSTAAARATARAT
jgi:hypothetical protein